MTDIVSAEPIGFIDFIESGTPSAPELDSTSLPVIGSNFDLVPNNVPGAVGGVFLMLGRSRCDLDPGCGDNGADGQVAGRPSWSSVRRWGFRSVWVGPGHCRGE